MENAEIATPPEQRPASGDESKSVELSKRLAELETSRDGLSPSESEHRIEKFGYNEIAEKKQNLLLQILSYFWGPIPWMIEAAAILSAVVGHWPDFGIIMTLLVANVVVGFWEEYQADNAIAALKARLALKARVKRGGEWKTIPARELVPGDVVRLRIGDVIPADTWLLDESPVEIDQSALTGESLPVDRAKGDEVYSGSVMKRGETDAVVHATGPETYFAKTARLVEDARAPSHFQRAVLRIGDFLIVVALVLVVIILGTALFRGDEIMTMLQFALVLTVAAIPAAMPTVLTVTMAVGARRLAEKQAISSRLAAIEELAGMDVLCSDKTGTLTQNSLTLGDPVTVEADDVQALIVSAALASRAEDEDPIDLAVLGALEGSNDASGFTVTRFQPFDPVSKRTEATVKGVDGREFRVSKGAPQVILSLAEAGDDVTARVDAAVSDFALHGYRALGVARNDDGERWQVLGVLPLFDPPREDSRETLEAAREMGVKVKMVTGDQVAIAKEIAGRLDMGQDILSADLFTDKKHHETGQSDDQIEEADGFAQVFPEHKYHIVDVLQKRGHIVGMTGDGVNDAPALKKAEAGIAVSGATDAARAAASIILTTPGLSVIVDAIAESRKIFQRMTSYAIYRVAETIRVLIFMTLAILVFNFYPVTAIMIVLLALLNDGAILSIAYDNVRYAARPEKWNMPVVLGVASVLGLIGVVASFGLFYLGERVFHLNRDMIQTLMYLKLSVAGQMTIFITRTRGPFWSIRPSRKLVIAVLVTQSVATLIAVYGIFMTPIGWNWAALVWGYAASWFVLNDLVKRAAYRLFDPSQPGFLRKIPTN